MAVVVLAQLVCVDHADTRASACQRHHSSITLHLRVELRQQLGVDGYADCRCRFVRCERRIGDAPEVVDEVANNACQFTMVTEHAKVRMKPLERGVSRGTQRRPKSWKASGGVATFPTVAEIVEGIQHASVRG